MLRSSRTADGGIDVARALRLIRIHWRFKLWGIDVDAGQVPTGSYVELLDWLVDEYARRQGIVAHVWVDHTPENINYAPLLLRLFPQARIVHLVRDGRAVAKSILPLDWGPNTVIRAAPWWRAHVREGLALEEQLPPSRILRVRFEDIVHAPKETIRRLCSGLDLPFEPRMLHADGFQPPDYTAGQHKMIGQRPNPGRAARWESELTPRQVEIFESLAGDLLGELGYPLLYGPQARLPTLLERGAAEMKELARANVNAVRWLIRSYPLWLSYDFLRALPDTWKSYHKVAIEGPIDVSGEA